MPLDILFFARTKRVLIGHRGWPAGLSDRYQHCKTFEQLGSRFYEIQTGSFQANSSQVFHHYHMAKPYASVAELSGLNISA